MQKIDVQMKDIAPNEKTSKKLPFFKSTLGKNENIVPKTGTVVSNVVGKAQSFMDVLLNKKAETKSGNINSMVDKNTKSSVDSEKTLEDTKAKKVTENKQDIKAKKIINTSINTIKEEKKTNLQEGAKPKDIRSSEIKREALESTKFMKNEKESIALNLKKADLKETVYIGVESDKSVPKNIQDKKRNEISGTESKEKTRNFEIRQNEKNNLAANEYKKDENVFAVSKLPMNQDIIKGEAIKNNLEKDLKPVEDSEVILKSDKSASEEKDKIKAEKETLVLPNDRSALENIPKFEGKIENLQQVGEKKEIRKDEKKQVEVTSIGEKISEDKGIFKDKKTLDIDNLKQNSRNQTKKNGDVEKEFQPQLLEKGINTKISQNTLEVKNEKLSQETNNKEVFAQKSSNNIGEKIQPTKEIEVQKKDVEEKNSLKVSNVLDDNKKDIMVDKLEEKKGFGKENRNEIKNIKSTEIKNQFEEKNNNNLIHEDQKDIRLENNIKFTEKEEQKTPHTAQVEKKLDNSVIDVEKLNIKTETNSGKEHEIEKTDLANIAVENKIEIKDKNLSKMNLQEDNSLYSDNKNRLKEIEINDIKLERKTSEDDKKITSTADRNSPIPKESFKNKSLNIETETSQYLNQKFVKNNSSPENKENNVMKMDSIEKINEKPFIEIPEDKSKNNISDEGKNLKIENISFREIGRESNAGIREIQTKKEEKGNEVSLVRPKIEGETKYPKENIRQTSYERYSKKVEVLEPKNDNFAKGNVIEKKENIEQNVEKKLEKQEKIHEIESGKIEAKETLNLKKDNIMNVDSKVFIKGTEVQNAEKTIDSKIEKKFANKEENLISNKTEKLINKVEFKKNNSEAVSETKKENLSQNLYLESGKKEIKSQVQENIGIKRQETLENKKESFSQDMRPIKKSAENIEKESIVLKNNREFGIKEEQKPLEIINKNQEIRENRSEIQRNNIQIETNANKKQESGNEEYKKMEKIKNIRNEIKENEQAVSVSKEIFSEFFDKQENIGKKYLENTNNFENITGNKVVDKNDKKIAEFEIKDLNKESSSINVDQKIKNTKIESSGTENVPTEVVSAKLESKAEGKETIFTSKENFEEFNSVKKYGFKSFKNEEGKSFSEVSQDISPKVNQNIIEQTNKVESKPVTDYFSILEQIDNGIKMNFNSTTKEMRIKLNPEELGELEIKINVENGIMKAEFNVESQKVKEIIESRFNELKQSLNEQGIDASALSVNISSGNNNGSKDQSDRTKYLFDKKNKINGLETEKKSENISKGNGVYGYVSRTGVNITA